MLSVAKITNLDLSNIEQPVIFDMFQDYPQPFTSNDISNSFGNINTSQVKKKKKIVYKKRTSNSAKSLGSQQQKPKKKIGEYEVLNEEQNNKNKRMKKKKDGEGSEDEVSVNGESNNDQTVIENPNVQSVSLKNDLVKSVAEKVNMIYEKFNNLLIQQEKIIESSSKENVEQQTDILNQQRAHFSSEMADELEKNIDFADISSNPELIMQLKQVYNIVKHNGSATSPKISPKNTNKKLSNLPSVELQKSEKIQENKEESKNYTKTLDNSEKPNRKTSKIVFYSFKFDPCLTFNFYR
jgi:hypothetical protein